MSLKEKFCEGLVKVTDKCKSNSPQILTGAIIFGSITSVVLASVATAKAVRKIDQEEDDRRRYADEKAVNAQKLGFDYKKIFDENYQPLTIWDKIRIGWPYYIPPFLSTCGVIGAAIGVRKIDDDRLAKETLATQAAQTALRTYQEKVVEQIGEKKERKIQESIHEDEIRDRMKDIPEQVIAKYDPMSGGAVFYDPKTGQFFLSTYEKVRRAADRANDALRQDEFYSHGLFIEDAGGHISEFSYMNGILSQGPDRNAIDQDYFLEPHIEEYNGHEITVVYMNYNTVTREYY